MRETTRMNSEWRAFLESQSARIDDAHRAHFPETESRTGCRLVDLSYLGLIAVEGPDARDFLQGQLTNDVRELSDRHSQLCGYCSAKGRMLANFRLLRWGERYLLQVPRSKLDMVLQRMRMFVLRSRTTLTDISDHMVAIGVVGDSAAEHLTAFFADVPELDNGLSLAGDLALIRVAGTPARFQVIGPVAAVRSLWQGLTNEASPADTDYWRLLDIRAGLPTIHPETTETFVPQMANMHLIDGVSFTKGCYTGQEVVARMQYLGRLKRRMYWAEVETATPPRPGDEVFSPDSHSQQSTGWVVDVQATAENRYELLAVVEIEAAEQDHVHLGSIEGPSLSLKAPPYGFAAPG